LPDGGDPDCEEGERPGEGERESEDDVVLGLYRLG